MGRVVGTGPRDVMAKLTCTGWVGTGLGPRGSVQEDSMVRGGVA